MRARCTLAARLGLLLLIVAGMAPAADGQTPDVEGCGAGLDHVDVSCPMGVDEASLTPSACPAGCRAVFQAWWGECSESRLVAALGDDLAKQLQDFDALCESTAASAPTGLPPAVTAGTVVALRDAISMNNGDRPHLLTALGDIDPPPTVNDVEFVKGHVASAIDGAATVIIYNQDNCYMDLSAADRTALGDFVSGGGVLVVMGDWSQRADTSRIPDGLSCDIISHDPREDSASYLLGETFGWTGLVQATSDISPSFRTAVPFTKAAGAAGTAFEDGPATLSGEVTYYSGLLVSSTNARTVVSAPVAGSRVIYELTYGGSPQHCLRLPLSFLRILTDALSLSLLRESNLCRGVDRAVRGGHSGVHRLGLAFVRLGTAEGWRRLDAGDEACAWHQPASAFVSGTPASTTSTASTASTASGAS